MMREYDLFVDGKFVPAARSATVVSTNIATGRPVSVLAKATGRDARRAIDAARRATDAGVWRDLPGRERAARIHSVLDLLFERQAEIADLDVAEAAVPIRLAYDLVAGALADARRTVDASGSTRTLNASDITLVAQQPHGVVAIAPADDIPFVRCLAAVMSALASGNTVVVRPPPESSSSAMELAAAMSDAGMPAGVVNILPAATADVDDECASNPFVDLLYLAGDAEGARRVAERAAQSLKQVRFDLAMGSTAIVRADADLDHAVTAILWGAMVLSGRPLRHCSRVVVDATIAEPFTYHLARGAAALRLGDPSDFATDLGPLRAAAAVKTAIERMLGPDAQRVGRAQPEPSPGHVAPVVVQAHADTRIAWDGLRGPVVAVIGAHSDAHAIEIATRPPRRDAASIFSRDTTQAIALARSISASTVWINDHLPVARAGDGVVFDSSEGSWDVRTRIAAAAPGSVREDPRMKLLGLGRALGFED